MTETESYSSWSLAIVEIMKGQRITIKFFVLPPGNAHFSLKNSQTKDVPSVTVLDSR